MTDRLSVFCRGGIFDEERNNGKIGELNDTNWKFASGGARLQLADGSNVEARLFYDNQDFFQNTFAVPACDAAAQPEQSVAREETCRPRRLARWSRGRVRSSSVAARTSMTAGTDFRRIDGDSDELTFALATGLTPLVHRVAGGTQRFFGVFAQDLIELTPKLQLTLSARIDSWRNFDAHNLETTIATGLPTAANRPTLADKSDTAVSPRVAALYRATDRVSVWGSVSNGFRAPTLKELYSPFRVGAVLTLSNETLGPERLIGQEAGISVAATSNMTVRGTLFNNRVNDPIANVTAAVNNVPATPGCAVAGVTTCRQLQNLGSTNISGFQTDVAYRVNGHWGVSGAYVFDIAKVHESKVDAAGNDLTGRYLAEVPKHRVSFQLTYTNPRYLNVAIENQFVGHQFDDDLNTVAIFPAIADKRVVGLPKYSVTNLTLARTINRNVDVFFGVQNLFGTTYYVGTNPTTIGTPRLVNGGLRLKVGR